MRVNIYEVAKTYAAKIVAKYYGYTLENAKKIFKQYYYIVEKYTQGYETIETFGKLYQTMKNSATTIQFVRTKLVPVMKELQAMDEKLDAEQDKFLKFVQEKVLDASKEKWKIQDELKERVTALMQADALNGLTNSYDPQESWVYQDPKIKALSNKINEYNRSINNAITAEAPRKDKLIKALKDHSEVYIRYNKVMQNLFPEIESDLKLNQQYTQESIDAVEKMHIICQAYRYL